MTSPRTERRRSVTSSGRSPTSTSISDLGVAVRDGGGDCLQHHRLAGFRRGHDEPALALADRGEQVDDPGRRRRVPVFQPKPLVGIQRGQVVEVRAGQAGRPPVDRDHCE
jgi:hypothetical protein